MLQNKNKIILLGAIAATILLNAPRLLITLRERELTAQFGLTIEDVLLRSVILFLFAWVVLSFNIKWKHGLALFKNKGRYFSDLFFNGGILLAGVIVFTIIKKIFMPGFLETRGVFFMTFFTYVIVHLILWLVAHLFNFNLQYQQSLLEKEQAKREALRHQLQALRNQINPHFLFNTLNSLNALIRQKSDNAPVFVDKLSWLLRNTLQRNDTDQVTVQAELEYLEYYIYLQKERFGEKLKIEVNIPEEWKQEKIPSFSLQLLVENAIKHNVISSNQPLRVDIYGENGFLIVSNILQKRRDYVDSTGTGLSHLSTRFRLLKKADIQISKNNGQFIVKLPIIKI